MTQKPLLAVTGATGFVGQYVVKAALDAGYRVRALIRTPSKKPDIDHENLTWHVGALGDDDASFLKKVDCLIHMAGLIKARSRIDYHRVNAEAAGALALASQKVGVKRFVLLSSMAARVPELSDYAASKHGGEDAVKAGFHGPLAIIRAPAVFGPGDEATAPFFKAMKMGVLPVPGGSGWQERRLSMVYVPDLARDMIERGLSGAYDGQTVSPATITDMHWSEFAHMASGVMNKPVRALALPAPLLYGVAGITSASSRLFGVGHLTLGKLREFLYHDWSSQDLIEDATPPKDALETTLRFYKAL